MDPKEIGLAAKDILLGIGTAAAGAQGGPAAAQGVLTAGAGIDRILAVTLPEDKKPSRAEKFDRNDFGPRAAPAPPPSQTPAPAPPVAAPPAPIPDALGEPAIGDAKLAWDHLRDLGWPSERMQQILGGPERGAGPASIPAVSVPVPPITPEPAAVAAESAAPQTYTVSIFSRSNPQRPLRVFPSLSQAETETFLIEIPKIDPAWYAVANPPLAGFTGPPQDPEAPAGQTPLRLTPGVTLEDVQYWTRALGWPEAALHPELRRQYIRNLRAAVEAAATPGVTPEDIAFWLHAFRTPRLSEADRRQYLAQITEGLRALGVLAPMETPVGPYI